MWRHSGQPVVHDAASSGGSGSGAAQRSAALATPQAPDFIARSDSRLHALSYRGRKVFSQPGLLRCRLDLPVWQSLFGDMKITLSRCWLLRWTSPRRAAVDRGGAPTRARSIVITIWPIYNIGERASGRVD
jgi:hypothetical protein